MRIVRSVFGSALGAIAGSGAFALAVQPAAAGPISYGQACTPQIIAAIPTLGSYCSAPASSGGASQALGSILEGLVDFGPDEFPTGRLRETWDGGLRVDGGGKTNAFTIGEASVFGSTFIAVPGEVLGGNLRLTTFFGNSEFAVNFGSEGKGQIDADFLGGSAYWSSGANYAMLTLVGVIAEAKLSSAADSYNIYGGAVNVTGGHVFELGTTAPISGTPVKLDARAGLTYSSLSGSSFTDINSVQNSSGLNGWSATGSITLYTDIQEAAGQLLRPYVKAEIRQQLSYDNLVDSSFFGRINFLQDSTLGVGEIGFDYKMQSVTFNGSVYGDGAGDRATVGAKFGARWTIN
jgi:hypothetical protein